MKDHDLLSRSPFPCSSPCSTLGVIVLTGEVGGPASSGCMGPRIDSCCER
jgi:hypothetical protein